MENKIEITEDAQNYIDGLIKKDKFDYFRITVLGGGCAGFQYKFDFDNKKNNDDILIKTNRIAPVGIVFPSRATAMLSGDNLSPIIPEPTTVATRKKDPKNSAK